MKKRKMYVFIILMLVVLFSSLHSITALGISPQSNIIRVTVDGEFIQFEDIQPQMINGRVLVPVRGVFEHMGFIVNWISHSRRATLTSGDFFIVIPADADYFVVNGIPVIPDVPQQLIGGRLMLPLRAVAEAVGGAADWDRYNQIAMITTYTHGETQTATPTPSPAPITTPTPAPISTPEPPDVPAESGTPILFDGIRLVSEDELLALIAIAPSHLDTRSATVLPNRRLTDAELREWITEYELLGGANAFELEVIRLVNNERASHGLPPFEIDPRLMLVARFRSQEMVDLNYFAHTSPVYGAIGHKTVMFGRAMYGEDFVGRAAAENIAGGRDPAEVVQRWMESEGHRRAILSPVATPYQGGNTTIGAGWVDNRITLMFSGHP